MEYRLRRNDGEYRWILDIGVPRFNPDGTFAGYIGSCLDITDRKLAEEALASVGRRLIEAHEEERTWIARELHDDIDQRVALLAVELERCNHQAPGSVVDMHESPPACPPARLGPRGETFRRSRIVCILRSSNTWAL